MARARGNSNSGLLNVGQEVRLEIRGTEFTGKVTGFPKDGLASVRVTEIYTNGKKPPPFLLKIGSVVAVKVHQILYS